MRNGSNHTPDVPRSGPWAFLLLFAYTVATCSGLFASSATAKEPDALSRVETQDLKTQMKPLEFRIVEGRVLNAFYQRGPVAAHLLLSGGAHPRVLVAFPAGNSGVGLWFEDRTTPVQWTLDRMQGDAVRDPQGRMLRGIIAEAQVDGELVVHDAVLSSVRVLRDYQFDRRLPEAVKSTPDTHSDTLTWARARLDGAAGYALSVRVLDGTLARNADGRWRLSPKRAGAALRLRIAAYTGEPPLTPLANDALLNANASDDVRSRQALGFLSYREKFLAGSWRFNTYFGRDTLMSVRLLMPALAPEAIESGLRSVLERLNADGEVAHEEDIGEFAVLRRRGGIAPADAKAAISAATTARQDASSDRPVHDQTVHDDPIYDYAMVDDDFMLAPVAAEYLLHSAEGRARVQAFLARTLPSSERIGTALARNAAFVLRSAEPFARQPHYQRLIAFKDERTYGQWRDSREGLAYGRYAYDVNVVFVPAALEAVTAFTRSGLLDAYATPQQREAMRDAAKYTQIWSHYAPPLFRVKVKNARTRIDAYARVIGVDAQQALASVPKSGIEVDALALDTHGNAIPIVHSDGGFALLFRTPAAADVDRILAASLRPFPGGLMTDAGLLVANPALAGEDLQRQFGRNAYHGTVVWSWQQALFAAGLAHQLQREDLPAETRARLRLGQRRLWDAIDATGEWRTSELWTWAYADGRYTPAAFGQNRGDADESNAAQLWSTVYLAIARPTD
jgi:hypothetical protein